MHKFDWLGQALAIVTGVADGERARSIVARYPHGPMGAPVIYPQQPGMPVYHNRAMWPFVTAYGLKAAAITGNVSVADAAYQALMRGAALNLSNMENLEWLSGQPLLLDEKNPSLIGPVINSKRQLWSVGAYLGMVIENVFGVSDQRRRHRHPPFHHRQTAARDLRPVELDHAEQAAPARQDASRSRSQLPPARPGDGFYLVDSVTVNGAKASQRGRWEQLPADSVIDIRLGALVPGQQEIRRVSADPYTESSAVFGPREPEIANFARDAGGHASFDIAAARTAPTPSTTCTAMASWSPTGVAAGAWTDRSAGATACYSVEAVFPASGNRSHHSAASCVGAGIEIAVTDARVTSNIAVSGPNERFARRT